MKITSRLIPACFFSYSVAYAVPRVLLFMAAQDIVSGTLIQSSIALSLYSCGDIIFRVFTLLVFKRIPLPLLMMLLGILYLTAYLLLVAVDQSNCVLLVHSLLVVKLDCRMSSYSTWLQNSTRQSSSAYNVGANTVTLLSAVIYTGK